MLRVESLFSIAGKHVLLTGGGRGIGKMIATGLITNGAHVAIASRDAKALAETAEELNAMGGGTCIALEADVGSRAGCEQLAEDFASCGIGGGVAPASCDVLINNSGASWGEPLTRVSGRLNWGWDKVLDVNVKAPFYLTRAMLPLLSVPPSAKNPADPARVINIGSIAGLLPQDVPTHAYDTSKAALHHLTKKLAAELARPDPEHGARPITVNAIAPGFVPTKMSAGLKSWGADLDDLAKQVPLGRCGDEGDMVGAALYLASPAAKWVTGIVLPVDGGATGAARVPVVPES